MLIMTLGKVEVRGGEGLRAQVAFASAAWSHGGG